MATGFNGPFYNPLTGEGVDWRKQLHKKHRKAYDAWFEAWSFLDYHAPLISTRIGDRIMAIEDMMPGVPGNPDSTAGLCDDPEFASKYPSVFTLCASPFNSAGKTRKLCTLVMFIDNGEWKVRLSERNHNVELWGGGRTLDKALNVLESRLQDRPVPWRAPTVQRR